MLDTQFWPSHPSNTLYYQLLVILGHNCWDRVSEHSCNTNSITDSTFQLAGILSATFLGACGHLEDTSFFPPTLLHTCCTLPARSWRLQVSLTFNSCFCRRHSSTSPGKLIFCLGSIISEELLSRGMSIHAPHVVQTTFRQICHHGRAGPLCWRSPCRKAVSMP